MTRTRATSRELGRRIGIARSVDHAPRRGAPLARLLELAFFPFRRALRLGCAHAPIDPLTGDAAATVEVETATPTYKNPLRWVPTSYLAMGLVYVTVGSVANIMLKNMGLQNDKAAFWSQPARLPLHLQAALGAAARALQDEEVLRRAHAVRHLGGAGRGSRFGLMLPGTTCVGPVLTLLAITAVAGATQDIGTDGVYVTTLTPKAQAKYHGLPEHVLERRRDPGEGPFVRVERHAAREHAAAGRTPG